MDPRLWWLYLLYWLDTLGPRWRTLVLVVTACALVLLLERFKRKRPEPAAVPHFERRREPRFPVDSLPVHISNADVTAPVWEGVVTNCSASGLGLRVDRGLDVGAILSVRPIHVPGHTVWALVEVKHCGESDGGWLIGCRFIRTPPWVAPLLKGD